MQPSLTFTTSTSTQSQKSQGLVLDALERLQHKSPGRQNSYSDSTDGDEEVEDAFSPSTVEHSRQSWKRSAYHPPSGTLGLEEYDSTGQMEDTIHSAFYSPKLSITRSDLSKGYAASALVTIYAASTSSEWAVIFFNLWFLSSPPSPVEADLESVPASAPSPDPLPPPLPLPLNLTMSSNGQEMEDFVPVSTEEGELMGGEAKGFFRLRVSSVTEKHLCCQEVELNVSLVKSDKGSLGFTLTKGNDHGCYIHAIVQDPAKGDGRLRAGDRMIMVGVYLCSFCSQPQTWNPKCYRCSNEGIFSSSPSCLQVNTTDVSNMSHTEVVNLVRAAPRVVDLLVGRVLEAPKPPIEAHLLPDIWLSGNQEPLGKSPHYSDKASEPHHKVQQEFFFPLITDQKSFSRVLST